MSAANFPGRILPESSYRDFVFRLDRRGEIAYNRANKNEYRRIDSPQHGKKPSVFNMLRSACFCGRHRRREL